MSPFARANPSDGYLARRYGIVSRTTPAVLSDREQTTDADLSCLLGLVEKHIGLWGSLPRTRAGSKKATALLASARSTVLAMTDALRTHDVARMCAVLYGRDLGSLSDAFCAPPVARQGVPEAAPEAVTLQQCAEADRALFEAVLARAITSIRGLWAGSDGDAVKDADAGCSHADDIGDDIDATTSATSPRPMCCDS